MNFFDFRQRVQQILKAELPPGQSVVAEGRTIAGDIQIGRTAFMDKMGVDSELEYKSRCVRDQRIMFHAHIGLNTWHATAEALAHIYKTAQTSGFVVDRAGICLDRRMGLPGKYRNFSKKVLAAGKSVFNSALDGLKEAGADIADPLQMLYLLKTLGPALEYARSLKKALQKYRLKIPVVMGGILNQKFENAALPVDATAGLKKLGVFPCPRLEGNFRKLLAFNLETRPPVAKN